VADYEVTLKELGELIGQLAQVRDRIATVNSSLRVAVPDDLGSKDISQAAAELHGRCAQSIRTVGQAAGHAVDAVGQTRREYQVAEASAVRALGGGSAITRALGGS